MTRRRRRVLVALAVPVALAGVVAVVAGPAEAYTTRSHRGCDPITWTTAPRVVLHTSELAASATLDEQDAVRQAMEDIHAQFNDVGATSAEIIAFEETTDAFTYTSWYGDPDPTIHVGFTSDATAALGGAFWDDPDTNCQYNEAHIQFQDLNVANWVLGVPEDDGEDYYDTGLTNNTGAVYFRISYLHELLHAFGLAHSADSYSMLNYGDRPWANVTPSASIRPLPDDVEGLRDLYPAAGTRTEVAVLNSWYDPTSLSSGAYPAANQKQLCAPSLGGTWDPDRFAEHCGTTAGQPGSTEVCAGDTLRARFAFANYSTESVDVVARIWFSADDQWTTSDILSNTTHQFTVSANGASQQGRVWEIPNIGLFNEFHVIVRVHATTPTGAVVRDWIPLRGTVQAAGAACLTAVPI